MQCVNVIFSDHTHLLFSSTIFDCDVSWLYSNIFVIFLCDVLDCIHLFYEAQNNSIVL